MSSQLKYKFVFSSIILVFIFSSNNLIYAQKIDNIELCSYTGNIIPHHANMRSLSNKYTCGFELNYLSRNFNDKLFFNNKYNFPIIIYGFSYENLGNNTVLGNAIAAYTGIDFYLYNHSNFSLNLRPNAGLVYTTKNMTNILTL